MPIADTDLFDPELYRSVRLPRGRARTLPAACYTDDRWFARELTRLFRPAWHFVALEGALPHPGDYLALTLLGEAVVVIRGDDNAIRAFRNTCRHRGSLLAEPGTGRCRALRCPYHSWTYGLDGRLLRAPGLEADHGRDGLDGLGLELLPLACGVREGLIFVNLAEPEVRQPLDVYLGDFVTRVAAPHRVADMVCVQQQEYVLETNWKLYVEVDMETLHTKHVHRSSIGEQPVTSPSTTGEWMTVFNESKQTPALPPGERDQGFPQVQGRTGDAEYGTHFSLLLPGFFLVTAQDCMWWIQKLPETPGRTRVRVGYCFPAETTARADFSTVAPRYIRRWDQVIREDDWIAEYQYRGLPGSVPGPYTAEEEVVHRLDNWILDRVLGD